MTRSKLILVNIVIERWNGVSWKLVPSPPTGWVSRPSSTSATAVHRYLVSTGYCRCLQKMPPAGPERRHLIKAFSDPAASSSLQTEPGASFLHGFEFTCPWSQPSNSSGCMRPMAP
jgi:hypothetical protein